MKCNKCNTTIADNAIFCSGCGADQRAAGTQSDLNQNYQQSTGQPAQGFQQQAAGQPQPNQGFQPQDAGHPNQGFQQNYQQPYQQPASANDSRIIAALAYIPILFWLPLAADKTRSDFGRKTANQGLLLLICSLANMILLGGILSGILKNLYYSSWSYGLYSAIRAVSTIQSLIGLAISVCAIIGIVKALKNELFQIPLIGSLQIIK